MLGLCRKGMLKLMATYSLHDCAEEYVYKQCDKVRSSAHTTSRRSSAILVRVRVLKHYGEGIRFVKSQDSATF
eukprot:5898-Heterococcus_DN1.PRE.1